MTKAGYKYTLDNMRSMLYHSRITWGHFHKKSVLRIHRIEFCSTLGLHMGKRTIAVVAKSQIIALVHPSFHDFYAPYASMAYDKPINKDRPLIRALRISIDDRSELLKRYVVTEA